MRPTTLLALPGFVLVFALSQAGAAGQQAPAGGQGDAAAAPQPPRSVREAAPIDVTGNWVSVVNEDWRWRMMTPPKGDYASVPLNAEGRRVADSWDMAADAAAGESCRPFGVGNIVRMPGRMRISWQDDSTLKVEFDAGTQTRLLHFNPSAAKGERSWQGHSIASWEVAGQQLEVDRNGIPVPPSGRGRGRGRGAAPATGPTGGSLKVVTTNMRAGYLRKNGVPYSQDAVVTEYFDRMTYPNGDTFLMIRTVVDDPMYLNQPFITSTHFKAEPDGSKWNPTPCQIDPPVERGK